MQLHDEPKATRAQLLQMGQGDAIWKWQVKHRVAATYILYEMGGWVPVIVTCVFQCRCSRHLPSWRRSRLKM